MSSPSDLLGYLAAGGGAGLLGGTAIGFGSDPRGEKQADFDLDDLSKEAFLRWLTRGAQAGARGLRDAWQDQPTTTPAPKPAVSPAPRPPSLPKPPHALPPTAKPTKLPQPATPFKLGSAAKQSRLGIGPMTASAVSFQAARQPRPKPVLVRRPESRTLSGAELADAFRTADDIARRRRRKRRGP